MMPLARVFLLLMVCACLPLTAQINLGILGSFNNSSINGSFENGENFRYESRSTFGVGGVINFKFPFLPKMQIEPMYQKKGSSFTLQGVEVWRYNLTYIEVPVLLKSTLNVPPVQPYFLVGPYFGFLLDAEISPSGGTVFTDPEGNIIDKVAIKEDTEGMDFGIAIGGGVDVPIGENQLLIELLYNFGLTDLFTGATLGDLFIIDNLGVQTAKNNTVQLKVGFRFSLLGD